MSNTGSLFKDDEKQDRIGNTYNDSGFIQSQHQDKSQEGVSQKEEGLYRPDQSTQQNNNVSDIDRKTFKTTNFFDFSNALGFLKNHKKGSLLGGLFSILFLFLIIFGVGFLISHEIITIEEDLLGYETKAVRYMFNKVDQKLMGGALCRHLSVNGHLFAVAGCSKDNPSDTSNNSDADPLNEDMNNIDFTDPQIKAALENQGIKVNTGPDGKFQSLTDASTGEPVSYNELIDRLGSIEDLAWNASQINTVMPLATNQAGADWSGIPKEDSTNIDQTIEEETVDGSTSEANLNNSVESNNNNGAKNSVTPQEEANAGDLGNVLNAADSAIQKGESSTQALDAAESAAGDLSHGFLATQFADIPCSVDKLATSEASKRIPEIISLLTRHMSVLLSVATQVKDNAITGKAVNKFMSLFNSTSSSTKGTFSSSAAWLRLSGDSQAISSANEISPTSLPTANAGTKLIDSINKTGVGPANIKNVCKIITSKVGGILQGIFGLVQVALDGITLGLAQIGITAALLSQQQFVQHVIVPAIVKYFTPVGLSGLEDSVQWMNNADAGANLMFNNYARRIGGAPLTSQQSNQLAAKATTAQNVAYASLPLHDRLFSFSDPRSLVSSLAISLPTGKFQFVSDIANYFIAFPKTLANVFSSILFSNRVFAGSIPTNPGAPYGITQYGFTTSELNNLYNPIHNEQYLYSNVSYDGKTAQRITLLGNPNDYPGAATDGSTTDILHCFTQSFAQGTSGGIPANFSTGHNNSLCGSEGNFDIANDQPQPITNMMVAESYCLGLIGQATSTCVQTLYPSAHANNDIGRFRQYLLETSIMNNYQQIEQAP